LHLSKEEQKLRFLQRLERPEKNWKFSAADIRERGFWEDYRQAYEEMIRETATAHAPWFVVPADHKWFTRLVVAAAVIESLDGLDLRYPEVSQEAKQALAQAREQLLAE
jgi:polyphosphate kinase 2 (PPK2 family)